MAFPVVKKIRRALGLPAVSANILRRVGTSDELLYEAVKANVNKNDNAFYNLLHTARAIRSGANYIGASLEGAQLLEMGTSRLPGLPFIMLLQGVEKYVANNIFAVDDDMSESYANLIGMTFAGFHDDTPERIESAITWEQAVDGAKRAKLRKGRFENHSPVPAEEIDLPDASIDVVVSLAVLEHVRRPDAVLANSYRILRPGGWCFHTIDLRDHRNFRDPFRFLCEEDADYEAACPNGENRLRASDWIDHFRATGFEIRGMQFGDDSIALDSRGRTDSAASVLAPPPRFESPDSLESRTPTLTESDRMRFAGRFRDYSLADLSQKSIAIVAQKN